jgi:Protein of unknown function (DUF3558)
MRIRHAAPVVGLLCLVLASCTTTSKGEATPATTTDVSTTHSSSPSSGGEDNLPSHGAPKVDVPLDTTRYQQDPCSILTASQAKQELNLPPSGTPEEIALGKGCEWFNPDTRGRVSVGLLTGNPRGLSGLYDANQQGKYPYFLPLPPIEGYPAVASDVEDRRPMGICIVDVGVTDQLVLDVYLQLSQANVGHVEPCEMVAKVAGLAIRTMKEGA